MKDERTYSLRAYPLAWPEGWKRRESWNRAGGNFKSYGSRITVAKATERILGELEKMGVDENNVVVSTNLKLRLDGLPRSDQPQPSDPGTAVYWRKGETGQMKCIAIDRYQRVEDNLAALAATLEAMRAIERHGGAEILERTFQGFAALPQTASSTWRAQLELPPDGPLTLEQVETAFRSLANQHHPDKGGDPARFREITEARAAARLELSA